MSVAAAIALAAVSGWVAYLYGWMRGFRAARKHVEMVLGVGSGTSDQHKTDLNRG